MTDLPEKTRLAFEQMEVPAGIRKRALANLERWLLNDQFADAWPQLNHLQETGRQDLLFDAFFQEIPFGTSGRRGPVGFGTNRFNPFTLGTSIKGHCDFLLEAAGETSPTVVIAYDVRGFHDLRKIYHPELPNPLLGMRSKDFARIAAGIYAENGIKVWLADSEKNGYVTTPELSFSIRELGASGGLNISASHNHPDDNGAKIYNGDGAQAVAPRDQELADCVAAAGEAREMPWAEAVEAGLVSPIPPGIHTRYIQVNLDTSLAPTARCTKIAFTPLHGTGRSSVEQTLQKAGFELQCLPLQKTPDGAFPTVPFNCANPEVPESMDLVTRFAADGGFDLALATDPDADRLGMAIPGSGGKWSFLDGNQIGLLLAAYLLDSSPAEKLKELYCITTTVTSSLLGRLFRSRGARCLDTLPTGFKYIAAVLKAIDEAGNYQGTFHACPAGFLLGTEESHGYLVTGSVRDKDAAGASLLLAELAARLKEKGESISSYLDGIYLETGYTATHSISTVMLGAQGHLGIRSAQDQLRQNPPALIGDHRVEAVFDYSDEKGPGGPILSDTDRMARNILEFKLSGGARLIARPSGTEPKHKIYAEVPAPSLGQEAPSAALNRQKRETDVIAIQLASDFQVEMLRRIGVELPSCAQEISDLVPLEGKLDFAGSILPQLVSQLASGKSAGEMEEWLNQRMEKFGADGRLLVGGAVSCYCRQEDPGPSVQKSLERLFALEPGTPAEEQD